MKKKGFTLVELLVAIAVIGILATVIIVALGSAKKKAQDQAIQMEIKSLSQEADMYGLAYNGFIAQGTTNSGTCPTEVVDNWGFLGTKKGIQILNSIHKRIGGGSSYCGISPETWSVSMDGTAFAVFMKDNLLAETAYAAFEGQVCFDSSNNVIFAPKNGEQTSDGTWRRVSVKTEKQKIKGKTSFRCWQDINYIAK